ncbi:MAG: AsmA family protein, partial [Bauldia sp.]|nr:AsmA family protein [Bauldia sp.]
MVGGAIVFALFAALIVPWFVNWDDYKTTFEHEAGRILGHPVHVIGSAKASILPSPSLTFTDVQVGQPNAPPMMTVDRFEVTIELMPLLQGQIRVVAMRLDRPVVRMSVDENGVLDWLRRSTDAETLDPDKVVLAAATIDEGPGAYSDAGTGVALQFSGITASIEARSLAGPWRADGSYRDGDTAVPFHLATGRRLDDGTIRLKVDASPPRWPVDVSADGVIGQDPASGLTYAGTYKATELVENVTGDVAPAGEDAGPTGWRSEGAFTLTGGSLAIDKAVLSNGPADRPSSLAGALTINFGNTPSFSATAEARQLDLDRTLGGGPNQPIEVPVAAERLVAWLNSLPIPHVPGRIAFNVPAVVVGGSVIQDVAFTAVPAAAGWEIGGFRARLPGQATVVADGVLTTDRQVGFVGTARLAVQQPATFASWWRGQSSQGVGRQLAAFDISGKTEIAPGRISVDNIDARIGDATITGRFAWSEAQRDHHRHLGTDLKADRIDFVQVKALAELLVGRDLAAAGVLADSYSVRLAAGAFQFDDINVNDVAVDAAYADDVLTVVQLVAGDLGGASFRVTSGRIDDLTTNPRGHLDARLEATTVDGLALIAGKFFPDSGLFQWLGRSADAITPAYLDAHIIAPPKAGASGLSVVLDGVAGLTTLNVQLQSNAHRPAEWRSEPASLSVVLDSPDSAGLARQIGLAATGADGDSGAHVEIDGDGVPADGLKTTIIAEIAGLTTNASGKLTFASGLVPAFAGSFGVSAFDLGSIIATAGLAVPGAMHDTAIDLDGTISAGAGEADLEW